MPLKFCVSISTFSILWRNGAFGRFEPEHTHTDTHIKPIRNFLDLATMYKVVRKCSHWCACVCVYVYVWYTFGNAVHCIQIFQQMHIIIARCEHTIQHNMHCWPKSHHRALLGNTCDAMHMLCVAIENYFPVYNNNLMNNWLYQIFNNWWFFGGWIGGTRAGGGGRSATDCIYLTFGQPTVQSRNQNFRLNYCIEFSCTDYKREIYAIFPRL